MKINLISILAPIVWLLNIINSFAREVSACVFVPPSLLFFSIDFIQLQGHMYSNRNLMLTVPAYKRCTS